MTKPGVPAGRTPARGLTSQREDEGWRDDDKDPVELQRAYLFWRISEASTAARRRTMDTTA